MRNFAWHEQHRELQLSDRECGSRPNRERCSAPAFVHSDKRPEGSADTLRSGWWHHRPLEGIWLQGDHPPLANKKMLLRQYRQAQLAGKRQSAEPFLGQFSFCNLPRNRSFGRTVRLFQPFIQEVHMPFRGRNRLGRVLERGQDHVHKFQTLLWGHRDDFSLGQSRHSKIIRWNRTCCLHFFPGTEALRIPRNSSRSASLSPEILIICIVPQGWLSSRTRFASRPRRMQFQLSSVREG